MFNNRHSFQFNLKCLFILGHLITNNRNNFAITTYLKDFIMINSNLCLHESVPHDDDTIDLIT